MPYLALHSCVIYYNVHNAHMLPKHTTTTKEKKKNPLFLTHRVGLCKTRIKWWTKLNTNMPLWLAVTVTTAVKTQISVAWTLAEPTTAASLLASNATRSRPVPGEDDRSHHPPSPLIACSGHWDADCEQTELSKLRSGAADSTDGENAADPVWNWWRTSWWMKQWCDMTVRGTRTALPALL